MTPVWADVRLSEIYVQPYIVKQGDYLAQLAFKFGFDADTVWNDPANADLQKLRSDANVLFPGDLLSIPDQVNKPPATQNVTTGATNTFVTSPPTVTVSVQLADHGQPMAGVAFTVPELPDLPPQTTGADGTAPVEIPVTLQSFTIALTTADGSTLSVPCSPGGLDPINTLSGIVQRLQHLAYLPAAATPDGLGLDGIRAALRAFKMIAQGGPPSPSSTPPPDSCAPGSGPVSGSSPPASAPASWPPWILWPRDDVPPDSQPPSQPPPSEPPHSAPPSSKPPASGPPPTTPPSTPTMPPRPLSVPPSGPVDDAGLSDAGVLDDETAQLLLTAHGGV